jgi:hypothetical protein
LGAVGREDKKGILSVKVIRNAKGAKVKAKRAREE